MYKKIIKSLFYVLAIYTILGFLVIPLALKTALVNIVPKETNSKLAIDKIYFNPYSFVLKISSIELKSPDDKPLVSAKLIGFNFEAYSLFMGALHVKNFILEQPEISLVYNKDKSINLTSIIKQNNKKTKQKDKNHAAFKLPRIILDNISIEKGHIDYEDYTRKNKFDFSLSNINFNLKNVDTNDFNASDATLKFYTKLSDGGFINFKSELVGFKPFIVKGSLDFESSKVYTPWRYMQDNLNIEVADGKIFLHTDYYTNLDDLNSTILKNVNIHLDNLRLKPKSKPKDILTLNSFYIKDATIKPLQADIQIADIGLDSLDVKVQKSKKGQIDWVDYVKTTNFNDNAIEEEISKEENSSKPWNVNIDKISLNDINIGFTDKTKTARNAVSKLDDFKLSIPSISLNKLQARSKKADEQESFRATANKLNLDSAKLTFKDKALSHSPETTIDKITLNAYDLDSKKMSWLTYDLSLRVNKQGYIKSDGKLSHSPIKQEGTLKVSKLSLKEITPYVQKDAFISIDDGYLNLNAKTKYAPSKKRADLNLNGYLDVKNFYINDSRDKTSLLSFNKLALNGLYLKLLPNRVYVSRVNLNSFYVNAIINKDKSMNLSSLTKESSKNTKALKVKKANAKKSKPDFKVKIKRVIVSNGSAKFADLSLPLEFRTNIHDLKGEIRAISNTKGENSYVDITGEVDKYGSTKLKGNINSSNPKAYTDLNLNFRNLELSSLSGYSASFAGYKIDEGKLYLDLGYNILNSTLKSSNSVIIKKIKLGDEIEDENITKLPLGFVIGLLEDDDGVIDIDLPIEGNIDEPDFKYGALVWRTLSNLVAKAVASPFNFLGSMLGFDGDKLESIDFDAGLSTISAPEKEKLDAIAKIMKKRPKIQLAISATYDEKTDKYALAKAKIDTLIMKENGIKDENNTKELITIDAVEDIYEDIKDDDGLEKIEDALSKKYSGNEFDAAYLKAAYEACISAQEVSKEELETLAKTRVDNLVNYLTLKEGIESNRVVKNKISQVKDSIDNIVKTKLQIDVK